MSVIQKVFIGHMLVAVAALAIGYAQTELPLLALLFVLLGGLWLAAHLRQAEGLVALILYAFLLSAALGILMGSPNWLMLLVSVSTLGAWDLDQFFQRLNAAEKIENEGLLWRAHLRRLALVEGLGLLAGLAALTASFSIPFWWEALLALITVISIRWVVEHVRKEVE